MLGTIGLSKAGSCPSRLAPIRPANAAAQLVLRTQAGRKEDATASLNLSVSPTPLRRYCCAVRRDARHTVRGQPRRKALRCSYPFCQRRCAATAAQSGRTKGSYPAGQVRRKEAHPRPYALVLTVTPDFS